MKNDLLTTIIVALIGVFAAYLITNMIVDMRSPGDFTFTTVDSSVSNDLALPSPEVFNYKALNPTVEVYVGNCTETNIYGECADESSAQIEEGIIQNEESSESSSSNSSSNSSDNSSNSSNSSSSNSNSSNSNNSRTQSNQNQRKNSNGTSD